jgi:hypothetical protein
VGLPVTIERLGRRAARTAAWVVLCLGIAAASSGCSKGSSSASLADGGDAGDDGAIPLCADDAGAAAAALSEAGVASDIDDFGPNASAAKMSSSLGRMNIYVVTTPRTLDRVDIYLASQLVGTRVTIAVQEAAAQGAPFQKLFDLQLDFATCEGWATTGSIALPLVVGHYYAIGLDPNQPITSFVSSDTNALPIDGAFGRLVSSKTTTSVSAAGLAWDKTSTAEFNRQRLATSPRAADARDLPDAGTASDAADAATTDATRG